jgi:hypothetical protein
MSRKGRVLLTAVLLLEGRTPVWARDWLQTMPPSQVYRPGQLWHSFPPQVEAVNFIPYLEENRSYSLLLPSSDI